ncbi:hypothetical protein Cantr_01161 [Candida viswanathii]|uniref:Uncharacterized protein n=1 Tax=Candida viswanathii TaxID=5486 RepID=A0A367YKU6_9ASCO|nr:hypothetical protein Cantr_01161 [Candida viswanathii]
MLEGGLTVKVEGNHYIRGWHIRNQTRPRVGASPQRSAEAAKLRSQEYLYYKHDKDTKVHVGDLVLPWDGPLTNDLAAGAKKKVSTLASPARATEKGDATSCFENLDGVTSEKPLLPGKTLLADTNTIWRRMRLHNYTIPDTENFGEEKTFPRCHVRTPEVTLPADFSLLVLYCKGPPSKNSIAFLADRSQAIDEAATSNYEP